ncbi:nucleotidyltransferase domain-containing protein [Shouchella patagoniensis]|uniref:nucleotidyltransferase domain-containing protein n=1 Tax=Shouchella patagoniensis TaxID=228576 RepID=UPI00099507EE|nr:nucleotidyltransferase domain-containing protein [Shouchella patagoniensis]
MTKLEPVEVARSFVELNYPNCEAALLAGSTIRGEATTTSDLDIVVFDQTYKTSFRESLIMNNWPIEVFLHTLESFRDFFRADIERGRPSLPRMVAEGVVLKDTGVIESIKVEATILLNEGPKAWTKAEIDQKRYVITDLAEDFIGSEDRAEAIFIVGELAMHVSEFILRTNKEWIGHSKWSIRALRAHNHQLAELFIEAFDSYYRTSSKEKVDRLVTQILKPYGGKLFHGYRLGRKEPK